MAKITMDMIKELRERTAAGVVDCKKILSETDGDIEKAVEELQKRGIAKAAKKAARIAAEGKVGMAVSPDGKTAALVEVNVETDFVSKGEKFTALYQALAQQALTCDAVDADALSVMPFSGDTSITVAQAITNFTAATGEKTTLRRMARLSADKGVIGSYNHDGGRICVLVHLDAVDGSTLELSKVADEVAMHVAAMNPAYIQAADIPDEDVAKQKDIFTAQVLEEGKPEKIAPKIVEGKLAKWKKECCLVDQVFVIDNDLTVGAYVSKNTNDAKIAAVMRFEVGEGMEKRTNDLAAEVAEMTS